MNLPKSHRKLRDTMPLIFIMRIDSIVAVKLLRTGLRGGTPLWGAAPHAQLVKMSEL
jgi:hypothetical protein